MQVAEGHRDIFSTNGHQLTRINGQELIVLKQDSIIAVIEDGEKVHSQRAYQDLGESIWKTGAQRNV